jgi:hypothetical protein
MTDNTASLPATAEQRERALASLAQVGVTLSGGRGHLRSAEREFTVAGIEAVSPDG